MFKRCILNMKNVRLIVIITASIMLFLSIVIWYWWYCSYHPSTDDAYVNANVINIASQVTGAVDNIYIHNYSYVKKNDLLFSIDPRPFQIAVDKAKAVLENTYQELASDKAAVSAAKYSVISLTSQLSYTEKNTARIMFLVKKKFYSISSGDQAINELNVAKANLAQARNELEEAVAKLGKENEQNSRILSAKADLANAELNLQYTKIYAPTDGYISNFELRKNSIVNANQPLFALIENKEWWVDANFKETDLHRVKPGQQVTINIDMYPNYKCVGVVENIDHGSGAAFSAMPPENATGNWVKVTQRFTVKIKISNPSFQYPLRIGSSSNVFIDTRRVLAISKQQ
jgi:membrane fusion protein, multidrug efflux system